MSGKLIELLTKHAFSTEFEYRGDVNAYDIVFEGNVIHQLKRTDIEKLGKDSVLCVSISARMKESTEKRIEITNNNGFYTGTLVKGALLSLTMSPEILEYANLKFTELLACPLLVHHYRLPADIGMMATELLPPLDNRDVNVSIDIILKLHEIDGEGPYKICVQKAVGFVLGEFAKQFSEPSLCYPDRFNKRFAALPWGDILAIDRHLAKAGSTDQYGRPITAVSSERVVKELSLIFWWCHHQAELSEELLKDCRAALDAILKRQKAVNQYHQYPKPAPFAAVLNFLSWFRLSGAQGKLLQLADSVKPLIVWLMAGISPEQAAEIALI